MKDNFVKYDFCVSYIILTEIEESLYSIFLNEHSLFIIIVTVIITHC